MLQKFFKQNPRIAVAYSGGVDSSYLIYAAKEAGCEVRAYFIKTQFQPRIELNDAIRFAGRYGISLTVDALNALGETSVAENQADRCYHCKTLIFKRLRELSKADGFDVLCDGTNADDKESERPGMRALRELGVISPLRDSEFTKADIRIMSKQAGLFTHDKPSYACLATRIPEGTGITVRLLDKIERAEEALHEMGFSDYRVRLIPPDGAKIQLPDNQFEAAAARRLDILAAMRFSDVVLDLVARK
jgi:uncharacterized protein